MKLIVHDYVGHPFQVQLSRELARRGHDVLHLYNGSFVTPRGELIRRDDDPFGFDVSGIRLSQDVPKMSFIRRFRAESEYAGKLVEVCERFGPAVVLSANTPSLAQHRLATWCQRRGVRLTSWIQDMYGLAAYRLLGRKLPGVGHAVGRYFIALDKWSARHSENIIVITPDFREVLTRWGIDPARVHVIHNWAPLEQIPERPRENDWSRSQGLGAGDRELGTEDRTRDNFRAPSPQSLAPNLRVIYSGTLAMKHNPALLLELAKLLDQQNAGLLIVISEGAGVEWLAEQAAAANIKSLRCLPFQPFNVFADVLGSADVLVAILEADAGVFSVPSKVLSYLCAGRPLLLAIPGENLAAQTVVECGAGLVVEPGDIRGFCRAAEELIASPEKRQTLGAAGRRYAESNFNISHIGDKFEAILAGC